MSDRQEIADAISSVASINCSPYYRQTTRPLDASVVLARMTAAANGFGFVTTFQVWIALYQDRAKSEAWIDSNHDAISAAMKRVWTPVSITPTEIAWDTQVVNGVVFEGIR